MVKLMDLLNIDNLEEELVVIWVAILEIYVEKKSIVSTGSTE